MAKAKTAPPARQNRRLTFRKVHGIANALAVMAQRGLPLGSHLKTAQGVIHFEPFARPIEAERKGILAAFTRKNEQGRDVIPDMVGLQAALDALWEKTCTVPEPRVRFTEKDLPKIRFDGDDKNVDGLAAICVDLDFLYEWPEEAED